MKSIPLSYFYALTFNSNSAIGFFKAPVWYLCRKEANIDLSFWHLWGWTLKPVIDTVVVLSVLIWKLPWLCFSGDCTRNHSTTLVFLLNHTHLPVKCCFILIEVLQRCKVFEKGVPRIHLFLFSSLLCCPASLYFWSGNWFLSCTFRLIQLLLPIMLFHPIMLVIYVIKGLDCKENENSFQYTILSIC